MQKDAMKPDDPTSPQPSPPLRGGEGAQARFSQLRARLRLPLIAAPMFLVSGVELVAAACRAGVVGAFPTANCRSAEELDRWLHDIAFRLRDAPGAAPYAPNLIVHRSNPRVAEDLAVLLRHAPELVITSVGSPAPVLGPLHDAGALVFADVASLRLGRAKRAGLLVSVLSVSPWSVF